MCIKLVKPLNPEAQEWRPTPREPPLLPHALISPLSYGAAPPPPHLVASFTVASQYPKMQLQTHFHHHPPVYTISFLPATPDRHLLKPAAAAPPPRAEITEISDVIADSVEPAEKKKVESPKCPRRYVSKKSLRLLPPRIQRALRSAPPPPPTTTKLEWRPKIAAASAPSAMTTLMIKNIPNQFRRDFMLNFLDNHCRIHSLQYDFFYLPIDFKKLGNLGYAFVNFTTNAAAMKMKKILKSFNWKGITVDGEAVYSNKVCDIKWARVQGKEGLVRRFARSCFKCSDREFLPVVLEPPRNGSDPNPPPPVVLGRLCGGPARSLMADLSI